MKFRKDIAKVAKDISPYQNIPRTFINYFLDLQGRDAWYLIKEWEGLPNSEILKKPIKDK
jgi:hypothetical protein